MWCWLVGCGAGLLAVGQLWPFGCGGVWWAVVLASWLSCWSVGCGVRGSAVVDGQSAVVLASQLWCWLAQAD